MATGILEKLEYGMDLKVNPATALLNEQIAWADANLSAEQKLEFYSAILELYADKVWAEPAIARIRTSIREEPK